MGVEEWVVDKFEFLEFMEEGRHYGRYMFLIDGNDFIVLETKHCNKFIEVVFC